jgi:hypothetical protein
MADAVKAALKRQKQKPDSRTRTSRESKKQKAKPKGDQGSDSKAGKRL